MNSSGLHEADHNHVVIIVMGLVCMVQLIVDTFTRRSLVRSSWDKTHFHARSIGLGIARARRELAGSQSDGWFWPIDPSVRPPARKALSCVTNFLRARAALATQSSMDTAHSKLHF